LFLLYATTGLRRDEVLSLKPENIDSEKQMITPCNHEGETKKSWVSFYNKEAEKAFSDAVGYYREMEGNKIICAFEDNGLPLEVAYKVARASLLLNMYKETETQIDTTKINDLINRISNDLNTFRGIKAKLTSIGKTSEDIASDIKTLETGIRDSLAEIQENLRANRPTDNNQEPP
jgi:hypothetical protein